MVPVFIFQAVLIIGGSLWIRHAKRARQAELERRRMIRAAIEWEARQ